MGAMTTDGASNQLAVCVAIDLGWRLAELYDSEELPGPSDRDRTNLPPHLPGFGEMTAHERARSLTAHVDADLTALGTTISVELPTASRIVTALGVPTHKRDDVRSVILGLYADVRDRLAGSDPGVALAFGLGRMLADTVLLPTASTPDILGEQFAKWRLGNAYGWLDDLDDALPLRSGTAVTTSMRQWEAWVANVRRDDGTVDPTKVSPVVIRALHRQGDMWRRLLTGEQNPEHLLNVGAYVGAAASMLANVRRLALHYLWKWLLAVLLGLGTLGTAVWAAVSYAPAGTDRVAAVLVSAAGFLGISWTGIRATLGRALRQAESAMWEAEVVAATGKAAAILPKVAEDRPQELRTRKPEEEGQDSLSHTHFVPGTTSGLPPGGRRTCISDG